MNGRGGRRHVTVAVYERAPLLWWWWCPWLRRQMTRTTRLLQFKSSNLIEEYSFVCAEMNNGRAVFTNENISSSSSPRCGSQVEMTGSFSGLLRTEFSMVLGARPNHGRSILRDADKYARDRLSRCFRTFFVVDKYVRNSSFQGKSKISLKSESI